MFKKSKIAAATLAVLGLAAHNAGAALNTDTAVSVDESGIYSQVLVFPFYNTNSKFATAFNIRNTSGDTKAVKLRIRESKYSNDALDYNLYLSPYDHYSFSIANLTADKAEKLQPVLQSIDTTCTFPALPKINGVGTVSLKNNVYAITGADKGGDVNEGYVEVIEMGVVDPTATVTIAGVSKKIVDGIKHNASSVPADCSVVKAAWDQGKFTQGGANAVVNGVNHEPVIPASILAPTGGLYGWSYLLDSNNGVAFVANPVAIRNYQTQHGQHYKSDDINTFLLPSLASGNVLRSITINQSGDGVASVTWANTTDYAQTLEGKAEHKLANGGQGPAASGVNPFPISHVLAATGVHNDYVVDADSDARTDWVVTFPMRKHGIYTGLTLSSSGAVIDSAVKFSDYAFYNREEQFTVPSDDGFSPVSASPAQLLEREVNILSFGKKGGEISRVLRSAYTKNIGVDYIAGWGILNFGYAPATTGTRADAASPYTAVPITAETQLISTTFFNKVYGVPALGFAALRGNYIDRFSDHSYIGETVPHVFTRNRAVKP